MLIRNQNTAVIAGAIAVAIVRIAALQPRFATPIEQSFGRSLIGFNPFLHQPPPPSYPLYVAAGKLVNFFVHSALGSLLMISAASSIAAFVLLARAFPNAFGFLVGGVAALIPFRTVPLPDAPAIACICAAIFFLRRGARDIPLGVAAAAAIGMMPQLVFGMVVFMALTARRLVAWIAFGITLAVEFLQVVQNIGLDRMRAFIATNLDLARTFDSWGARGGTALLVAALTYHFVGAKAADLAGHPHVQRGGEH